MPLYVAGPRVRGGLHLASAPPAFDPLTLSPTLWVKTDTLSAHSDGDSLATWTDSSGNGWTLAPTGGLSQPVYKANIQNGRAVVRFDGINQQMGTTGLAMTQPEHVFFACKWNTAADDSTVIDGTWMLIRQMTGRVIDVFAGGEIVGPGSVTDVFRQYSCLFSGASSEIRVDGGAATTGNAGALGATNGVSLGARPGGSAPGAVDIGEVLVFPSALSSGNRVLVENYLRGRWGTA